MNSSPSLYRNGGNDILLSKASKLHCKVYEETETKSFISVSPGPSVVSSLR